MLVATSSAAPLRSTHGSASKSNCGHVAKLIFAFPSSGAALIPPGSCKCPGKPCNGLDHVSAQSPQQLFAREKLKSGLGKLTFSSTAPPLPFTCSLSNKGIGTILPGGKTSRDGPVIFNVSQGVFSCWATDGSPRSTGMQYTSGTEQIIAGKTHLVIKHDPVFGMVRTRSGGWKIQVHQGAVLVGRLQGKTLVTVRRSQQVVAESDGTLGAVGKLVPDTNLKAAFLAVQPALCEKPVLTADAKGSHPQGLAKDRTGNIWFTDDGTSPGIGVYHSDGSITEYTPKNSGLNPGTLPRFITMPDKRGDIWFTDDGATPALGMINPATKTIREFTVPPAAKGATCPKSVGESTGMGSCPWAPVVAPRGIIWFTNRVTAATGIGMYNPATKQWKEFGANLGPGSDPEGIAVGADGNLWFTDDNATAPAIGRITPSGTISEFSKGLGKGHLPRGITAGSDGTIWFADEQAGGGLIGMINPKTASTVGSIEYDVSANGGVQGSLPEGLAADRKGDIWFTDQVGPPGAIGLLNPQTGSIIEKRFANSAKPIGIIVTSNDELWYLDQDSAAAKVGTISPSSTACS